MEQEPNRRGRTLIHKKHARKAQREIIERKHNRTVHCNVPKIPQRIEKNSSHGGE
uniref:Uncharacterized protein n=1 Tax=Rhizophora mucronata TaxID=61149 RepID=A0A2P2NBZ9_RHIMU